MNQNKYIYNFFQYIFSYPSYNNYNDYVYYTNNHDISFILSLLISHYPLYFLTHLNKLLDEHLKNFTCFYL
jgi:hypothetical protein